MSNADLSKWITIMPNYRPPRVFISYRHTERNKQELAGRAHNALHWAWVKKFAEDLERKGVDVVHDLKIQMRLDALFGPKTAESPAVANIIVACMQICDFFMPIITSTYLKRIGYEDGTWQESWEPGIVHDEFQHALRLSRKRQMGLLTILREGRVKVLERAQLGWNEKNVVDMTDLPLIEGGEAVVGEVDLRSMKTTIKGTVTEKRSVKPKEQDRAYYERAVTKIGEVLRTSRGNRKPAVDMELDAFLLHVLFDWDIL